MHTSVKWLALIMGIAWPRFDVGAATNPNYLPNPGFETVEAKGMPDKWSYGAAEPETCTVAIDKAVVHSGKQSLHITFNPAAGPKILPELVIYNDAPGFHEPGKRYTYSMYVKTKGLAGRAALEIIQANTGVTTGTPQAQWLTGDHDWTRLSVTFTAAPDKGETFSYLSARINVLGGAPGKLAGEVWVDSGKLEEGEAATDFVPDAAQVFYKRGGSKPWNYPINYTNQVSLEVETPHSEPAKPAALKKPSVLYLFIYANLRDAVELAERLEMDVDSVPVNGLPGQIYFEVVNQMRTRLKHNPQIIVAEALVWEALAKADRQDILERVKAGAGLVITRLDGSPQNSLKEAMDAAQVMKIPGGQPIVLAPDVTVYIFGAGRILVAPGPIRNKTNNTFGRESGYDRIVRAIHAAGGTLPPEVGVKIAPAMPVAGQPWQVQCDLPAGLNAVAALRVRLRPARFAPTPLTPVEVLNEQTVKVVAGQASGVTMPSIPAGNYMVEASALNAAGRVIAWSLKPCVCDGPARIWSIEPRTPRIPVSGALEAIVKIENRSTQERALALSAEARDTENRLVGQSPRTPIQLKPGMNDVPLGLTVSSTAMPQVRLAVDLFENDTKVDSRQQPFSAEALLREPDFRFIYYIDFFDEGVRRLGGDTSVINTGTGAADLGFRAYPYLDAMPGSRFNAHYMDNSDSVTSDKTREKMSKTMIDWCQAYQPYRQVAMVIGDEWTYSCHPAQVPADTAYFRKFLGKMYGTVDKLNASWKTNLKSFDEVTLDMGTEEKVRGKGGEPARWADLRRMAEVAVAEYIQIISDAAKTVDPEVRLGFGGTYDTTSTTGIDWWLLMQSCGAQCSYGYVHTRLEESFATERTRLYQPSYVHNNWHERARHDPWRDTLLQRDGYYHYGGHFSEIFLPDYSMYTVGKTIAEEIAAIRSGPARLIRMSRMEDYGVGILYSIASYHASSLPAIYKTGPDVMNDILTSLDAALSDTRLNARFYSYEQLARGEVKPEAVKLFILPCSIALSAAEVAAVRQYVMNGGVVLADLRPAVYDEHCHLLKTGALDDVFGIEPVGQGKSLKPATLSAGKELPGLPPVPGLAGEWDLKLKPGAVALGSIRGADQTASAPAIVEHSFGKGRAILLNYAFPDYAKIQEAGAAGEESIKVQAAAAMLPVKQYLATLLDRAAAIRPIVRLVDPRTHDDLGSILLRTYRDGAISYFGFLQYLEDVRVQRDATLVVQMPGEVYDVRAGKYLGNRREFPVTVEAAKARLFSVLPYKVKRVTLQAPAKISLGGRLDFAAAIEAERGKVGRHVIVARLTRPDGSSKEWDRFTLVAAQGNTTGSYHFALNDPAGKWTLQVTDAATGVSRSAAVAVAR